MTNGLLEQLFTLDNNLAESEAGNRALQSGLLAAKKDALKIAQRLARCGRPLQGAVLFVSVVHIFSELVAVHPDGVQSLKLPDWVYHGSAFAFTALIDCVALYVIAAQSTAEYIGRKERNPARYFFYLITALLNGAFLLSYTAGLPNGVTDILPSVRLLLVGLLAALVPLSLASIEAARRWVEFTRLGLLTNVKALEAILAPVTDTEQELRELRAEVEGLTEALRLERELRAQLESSPEPATAPWNEPEQIPAPPLRLVPTQAKRVPAIELCGVCGVNELTINDKSVAGRKLWQQRFDGKYACKSCRNSWKPS